jgi:hypothetical protein
MRAACVVFFVAACAKGDSSVTVSIAPAMPTSSDDLVATATGMSKSGYTIRWSRNGMVQTIAGAEVGASEIVRGDVWKAEALEGSRVLGAASVTIGNSPPTAPTITLPMNAAPTASLVCAIVQTSFDIDGDPITYTAQWTRNNAPFAATMTTQFANDTVPVGSVAVGDDFRCIVYASDGMAQTPSQPADVTATCAASLQPQTFAFTGAPQTYVVPTCATGIVIEAWGAQGGGSHGGLGGYARAQLLNPTPGAMFVVEVGGQNGYNGGGAGVAMTTPANGGGASDVRSSGGTIADRVLVAGAGGGGGNGDGQYVGGSGGGGTCGANYCGGGGGAGYGGAGGLGGQSGGTGINAAHAGGAGGGGVASGGQPSCETYDSPSTCGTAGMLGIGGVGGPSMVHSVCYTTYGGTAGGGGGYYGGGGTAVGFCGSGAGGGGTSWTGTLTSPMFQPGVQSGDGKVTITPTM